MDTRKPFYTINEDQAHLHVSQGNSKIGRMIWSFSTLPGNEEHMLITAEKGLLTDVPGTCSRFCESCFGHGCYAVRDAKLRNRTVIPAWGENTVLLRSGEVWDQLATFITLKNGKAEKFLDEAHKAGMDPDEALKKAAELAVIKVFRINVSGEIQNVHELRRWNLLALAHPYIRFGLYTKNFDALAEFLDDGVDFADNLTVNVSQWAHCADEFLAKYSWAKLNVFEYCPTNKRNHGLPPEEVERLEALPKCPAVTRAGHHAKKADGTDLTCSDCENCYRKTGRHIAVWSH